MMLSHCHDDCVYSATLSCIVVVVILQSFKVFLLFGTDTLSSLRSSVSFQKFGFDFLYTQPSTECHFCYSYEISWNTSEVWKLSPLTNQCDDISLYIVQSFLHSKNYSQLSQLASALGQAGAF